MERPSRSYSIAILRISNFACFRGYSLCNMPKYVDFSVLGLQSDSPALGVWIKIRILSVFFNQRYELGPKATISTCSRVGLIMLSGELSDSVDSHPLCFQCWKYWGSFSGISTLGYMWVVLRRTKFVLQARKSLSPLSTYSSCKLHISGHDGNSSCMDSTQVRVFKQAYQISLCCFQQTFYCCCLDP